MSDDSATPSWEPISKVELLAMIAAGASSMDASLRAFWERVRIEPVKWSLSPWGDLGGGFWVVAIVGQQVIWFNDIEDGFNRSLYDSFNVIGNYWCDQYDLRQCIYWVRSEFNGGPSQPYRAGPPEAFPTDF